MSSQFLIYTFSLLLLFSSCQFQDKKQSDKIQSVSNSTDKMNVLINFYPSSGGDSIYTIEINESTLQIINHEEVNVKKAVFYKKLTYSENKKISSLIKDLTKRKVVDTEIILDSWRVELKVNDEIYYNESDVKIKSLPIDIKNLIEYVLRESKVKIDLYGFS